MKARTSKIIVLTLFLLLMLVVALPMVTASKTYDEDTNTYTTYDYLFFKKYSITLNKTHDSLINAYAEGELIVDKESKVFKDMYYKDTKGNSKQFTRDYTFYLNYTYQLFSYVSNVSCETINISYPENESYYQERNCTEYPGNWINDTKWRWQEVNLNEKIPEGHHLWRVEMKKPLNSKIDFIITTDDEGDLDKWAWLNSTFNKRRPISNLTVRFTTINVSHQTDMQNDFGDVRFSSDDNATELNYTIRSSSSGAWAYFSIDTNDNATIYMYYDTSSTTPTTESTSDTYLQPVSCWLFDNNTNDNCAGLNNLTNSGTTFNSSGYIGSNYKYVRTESDYMIKASPTFSFGDELTIVVWANFDGRPGNMELVSSWSTDFSVSTQDASNQDAVSYLDSGTFAFGGDILDDVWFFQTLRYNGSYISAWINNTEIHRDTATGNVANTADLTFGRRTGLANYLNGRLDEVYIFDKALSDDELTDFYEQKDETDTFILGAAENFNTPPVVLLQSPANDTTVNSNGYSATFIATATDYDDSIDNCTLMVWNNSDNSLKYSQTNTSVVNNTNVSFTQVLAAANYSWNMHCLDSNNGLGFNATNWTINVIPIPDNAPDVTLYTPVNNTQYLTSPQTINFTCSASDDFNLVNVSLFINNVINQTNSSGFNNTNYTFTTSLNEGNYDWTCQATDNSSQARKPTALDFIIDAGRPNVTITAPANGTIVTQFNESFQLNWTIEERELDLCWWTNSTDLNGTSLTTPTLDSPDYYWAKNNSISASNGDFWVNSVFGISVGVYDDAGVVGGGWSSLSSTIPNCLEETYTKDTLTLTGNVGQYFCMLDHEGNYVLFQVLTATTSQFTLNASYYNPTDRNFVTCTDNTTDINYPISNPSQATFYLFANDTLGNVGFDSTTLVKSTTAPQITIDSPLDNYARLEGGTTLYLNATVTNTTVLDSCIYEYNGANTSFTCANTINETFSYVGGVNTILLYINDTLGNINLTSRNWTIDLVENSQTFPATTTEGSTETFSANVTLASGVIVQSVGFVYDGTTYIGEVFASGADYIVRQPNFIIPNVDNVTNVTFYFNLSLSTGSNAILTAYNTTVSPISIDDCSNFTNTILWFLNVDEKLQTVIPNSTIEYAVNIFTSDGATTLLNISNESTNNPLEICLGFNLTNNSNYLLDTIVKYTGSDGNGTTYSIEYYNIDGLELDNETELQNITLYDLNSSQATEFKVTYTGSDFVAVENALIFVNRQYISENVFKTVELPKTDNNGQTLVHLVRNDQIYNFAVVVEGVVVGSFNNIIAFCDDFTIGDCQIQLNGESTGEEIYNSSESLGITYTTPTYNNVTRFVTMSFVTSDGSVKDVVMNVTRNDVFGNRSVCSSSVSSSGGSLTCEVPSYVDDTTLRTTLSVDGLEAVSDTVILQSRGYGVYGYFVLFVYILSLSLMFARGKTLLIVGVTLGVLSGIGLGLLEGKAIGGGAIGISLIVAAVLMMWKLNKEKVE